MIHAPETPIRFDGNDYAGIKGLGFSEHGGLVAMFYVSPPPEPRGTWMTVLPISKASYRAHSPTQAAVVVQRDALVIRDDWGTGCEVVAPREILYALLADCAANGLPVIGGE